MKETVSDEACIWHVILYTVRWPAMVERDPDFNAYSDVSVGSQDLVCI